MNRMGDCIVVTESLYKRIPPNRNFGCKVKISSRKMSRSKFVITVNFSSSCARPLCRIIGLPRHFYHFVNDAASIDERSVLLIKALGGVTVKYNK